MLVKGNIGSESTLNLNIAIPPLTEQHRIVARNREDGSALIDHNRTMVNHDLQSTIKQTKKQNS